MARPLPLKDDSTRTTIAVLAVGGFVVLGLVAAGVMVWLRQPAVTSIAPRVSLAAPAPLASAAAPRLEPSSLLGEARRQASAWRHDAVLVSLSAGPLDARGVAEGGKVEIHYAKPSGQRLSGGADAGGERLVLTTTDGSLTKSEQRSGKGRVAPEPNCLFEDAWAAAQRAGADPNAGLSLRYSWSDKQGRPIWEVLSSDGGALRKLDGVSCSILTR
jgi:hypothetical protein